MRTRIQNRYFGRPVGSLIGLTALKESESSSAIKNRQRKKSIMKNWRQWPSEKLGQAIGTDNGLVPAPAKTKNVRK